MSTSANVVHASADLKAAKREIDLFFKKGELFSYEKPDLDFYYADDEK